jgi:hypothetical protein
MRAEGKGAERERPTNMPFESAPSDEHGYLCGETPGARLARTDGDRAEFRGVIGARDKTGAGPGSTGRQEQEPDWCSLILDVLVPLQALLVSHGAAVPYSAAREAVGRQHDDQAALTGAVQRVVAKHSAFFAEWQDAIGLGVTLTALQAAQLDPLLRSIDRPLSLWEVCGSTLLILAPVLIPLAIYLLNLFITKLRG